MLVGGGLQTEVESNDDCFRCAKRKNCDDIKRLEYADERKTYHVTECGNMEPLSDKEIEGRIGK